MCAKNRTRCTERSRYGTSTPRMGDRAIGCDTSLRVAALHASSSSKSLKWPRWQSFRTRTEGDDEEGEETLGGSGDGGDVCSDDNARGGKDTMSEKFGRRSITVDATYLLINATHQTSMRHWGKAMIHIHRGGHIIHCRVAHYFFADHVPPQAMHRGDPRESCWYVRRKILAQKVAWNS